MMRRAIGEARRAEGRTSPNPMVGCVIAREGSVVATGYHEGPGRRHAEVAALEELEGSAKKCDMYVNLEPCCHHGRTPPCTDELVDSGVERVFVGIEDPDPRVCGGGIRRLREAGIEVVVGVLEEESRALNRGYFRYIEEGRPWVSVKYAMTLDGKIATHAGESAWITGEEARRRVHELRDVYDAIMVGTGTFASDDPRLTSRIEGGVDPIRVVLDARLEGSLDSNLYAVGTDDPETLVVVGEGVEEERVASGNGAAEKGEILRERGLELIPVSVGEEGWVNLGEVLEELAERGIVRLFVEGGGALIGSLFDRGLVDRVYAFVAPKIVGGREAPSPVEGRGVAEMSRAAELIDGELESLGADWLISGDLPEDGASLGVGESSRGAESAGEG